MGAIFTWVIDAVKGVLMAILTLVMDAFIAIMKMLLDLVLVILDTVGEVPGADFIQAAWMQIPETARDMALRLGMAEISVMIVSAITIRLILQLIPFVRLGS